MEPASPWWRVNNVQEIPSPALLLYPERVAENVRRMIGMAGRADRLWPHVKTHKMAELVRMQMAEGLTKFKVATIAEAEMAANCGAGEVLLAYQPAGPNAQRLLTLVQRFPNTHFSTVVDDEDALRTLADVFQQAGHALDVLLDVDCGMHRTGVLPGDRAVKLYSLLARQPGLRPGGLHSYDGHIHDSDPTARSARCEAAFQPVLELRETLQKIGIPVPKVVAGGTPTFPVHARRMEVECSPGTCVLWDAGYGRKLADLDFLPAALVLTRVVSKPGVGRLCLDLGHKAVASENPHPRVELLELPDAKAVMHSEEHLVVETNKDAEFSVGDCLFGVPWHICPTVALHSEATVVRTGEAQERWSVSARERRLTI